MAMDFFYIDLWFLEELAYLQPLELVWYLFLNGGWIFVVFILLTGLWQIYKFNAKVTWAYRQKFVLLAIDVPKENLTSPRAVENIFSQFAGAHGSQSWWEANILGEFQLAISLEIVSVEGYIQYLIHTPEKFRDVVEAAIYAQYPDAQITEVEDYTNIVPEYYPDDEYDMFGVEMVQVKHEVYPIRTYKDFEDKLSGEFIDPMAAMLETMSRVGAGEHLWYQIIISPIDDSWKKGAKEILDEELGVKKTSRDTLLEKIIFAPITFLSFVTDMLMNVVPEEKREAKSPSFAELTTGKKEVIENIEKKISKIGFKTKIRFAYVAKKEVMKKSRVINPYIGAIKQYNTVNLNAIKPALSKTAPSSAYFFVNLRNNRKKRRLMKAYKSRSASRGVPGTGENKMRGSVFNIEELATLWHFPVAAVKAPLIKKTESRRAEPPSGLPVGEAVPISKEAAAQKQLLKDLPPSDEPTFAFDYTDKEFERRFAKNKEVLDLDEHLAQEEKKKASSSSHQQKTSIKSNTKEENASQDDTPDNRPVV